MIYMWPLRANNENMQSARDGKFSLEIKLIISRIVHSVEKKLINIQLWFGIRHLALIIQTVMNIKAN